MHVQYYQVVNNVNNLKQCEPKDLERPVVKELSLYFKLASILFRWMQTTSVLFAFGFCVQFLKYPLM